MKLLRQVETFTAAADSYFEKVNPTPTAIIMKVAVYSEAAANANFRASIFKEKVKGVWLMQESFYAKGSTATWKGIFIIEGGEIFNVMVVGTSIKSTAKFFCEVIYE